MENDFDKFKEVCDKTDLEGLCLIQTMLVDFGYEESPQMDYINSLLTNKFRQAFAPKGNLDEVIT
jgi:hypothetical protein